MSRIVDCRSKKDGLPWYWKGVDLFDGAEPGAREDFFSRGHAKIYSRGSHVFLANDPGQCIFYLESGLVKIYHLSAEGTPIIFWFCVPGDLFGAGGITGSFKQSVYGEAMERSMVRTVSRDQFEDLLQSYPRLAINVIKLMGARLRLACDSMVDLVTQRVETRVAGLLLRLAENCGETTPEGIRIKARITHQEMADMIGTTRQSVNEGLHRFCRENWIAMDGRRIFILDEAALAAEASIPAPG